MKNKKKKKKPEMSYYRFIEHNEWEGESWEFYIPMTEAQFFSLRELVGGYESYELSSQKLSESYVDDLIKTISCSTSYMDNINKCSSKFKLPRKIDWDEEDPFYKGGLWEVIKSNGQT